MTTPIQRGQFKEARRLERQIYVNVPLPRSAVTPNGLAISRYATNAVSTARYNLMTFIPKNVFEQFRGLANVYFLGTVLVQLVPGVQSIPVTVAMIPLIFILVLTGIKDAVEDYRRHTTDKTLNNSIAWTISSSVNTNYPPRNSSWYTFFLCSCRKPKQKKASDYCTCIKPQHDIQLGICIQCTLGIKTNLFNSFKQKKWKENRDKAPNYQQNSRMNGWTQSRWTNLRVGDFVLLKDGDNIPADLLVLATSEHGGICYAETKSLDGETNLKIRDALKPTAYIKTAADCLKLKMIVETELPYSDLYVQNGKVRLGSDECTSFNIKHMLLRGSVLRNTDYVIGCVLYTGVETKVVLNSGITPSKRSKIDRMMNPIVIVNVVILVLVCLMNAIVEGYLYNVWTKEHAPWIFKDQYYSLVLSGLENLGASFVMLQNLVPISLYLTIEAVKTIQAYFIYADLEMYDAESGSTCQPKTWSISDDLGQIDYVFSDKTGTLTENKMDFKKCSIRGVSYGRGYTDVSRLNSDDGLSLLARIELEDALEQETRNLALTFQNAYMTKDKLSFIDTQIFTDLESRSEQSEAIVMFFLLLASCHTVLSPKRDPTDKNRLIYPAQSPDEEALVKVARDMGIVFLERQSDRIVVMVHSVRRELKILNVLEFNSTRKRMSIIIQEEDGSIFLLTKGADNVIFERLGSGQDDVKLTTLTHLEGYANEGLRTLCLARRQLTLSEYETWDQLYQEANASIHDRESRIEAVAELVEKDLALLGATAIEDKLQDKVPECLQTLRQAGIKIWVLTGDKKETAINIGFAANLFSRDMNLICIEGEGPDSVHSQIKEILFNYKSEDGLLALVIDGNSLRFALDYTEACKLDFLKLGIKCRSVICCRVSPKQKAQVVSLMKAATGSMCLAIGDGANDCSMIQEAHIGIGIAGQEGLQAAMASDYVIAKFKFLSRLLLVHGHWSYYRIGEMVLNFFFKNVIWVAVLFWYQFFSGFSSNLLYNFSFVMLFNLLFTTFPPVMLGVFDQDISAKFLLAYPELYRSNIKKRVFSYHKFAFYMFDALFQSAVCFFIMWYQDESFISPNGQTSDRESLGTAVAIVGVMLANYYIGLSTKNWTWLVAIVVIGSAFSIICWIPLLNVLHSDPVTNTLSGIESTLMQNVAYWSTVVLTLVACILPRYVLLYIQTAYFPTDIDIIREEQNCNPEPIITKQRFPVTSMASVKVSMKARIQSELWDAEMNYLPRQGSSPSILGTGVLNMRTNTRGSHHGYAFSGLEGERVNVERILGLSTDRDLAAEIFSEYDSETITNEDAGKPKKKARKRTTSADKKK